VRAGPAPEVTVESEGFETAEVSVTGANEPFWLILGQSHNLGWTADVAGQGDQGEPTLINGYANGWLIEPGDADELSVSLEWKPQRIVWIGLILSTIGVVGCLALIMFDPRRRKVPAVVEAGPPLRPVWSAPWAPAPRLATRPALIGGLVALVLMGLFSGPVWGLLAGAGAVLAVRWRWGLTAVRLGAVAGLTASALYITGKQFFERYPPDFNWPTRFEAVHWLGLLSVALLVIDAVLDVRAQRRAQETT
jgi:arabinofuranan 3-O-arabinosyltransferase